MTWQILLSFGFVAILLVVSPGPNGVLLAKTVPTSGRAAGFANVAGFFSAFYLHGALVVFGISVILVKSAELFFAVKMLGAAYLCWLGIKALREAWQGVALPKQVEPSRRRRTLVSAYVEGLLTNALNPKVSMFYLAAVPQFLPLGQATAQNVFLLVLLHSTLNAIWFCAMVILFDRLTSFARQGNAQRWIKGITGIVFVGFGAKLASIDAH